MPVAKITKLTVKGLRAEAKPYVVYDSETKGFGIRVMPSGVKSWVIEYRPGGGGRATSKRRFKFAEIGELTAEQARKVAGELLAKVRLGADPAAERKAAREQATVGTLIDDYLGEVDIKLKPSTAAMYRGILLTIIKPRFGAQKAVSLTRSMVARLHSALKATPYQANRMLAVIGAMYSYAETHHLVPDGYNPARKIKKHRETARERYLTNDEFERLGAALREAETTGIPWIERPSSASKSKHLARPEKRFEVFSPFTVGAIRLLLLTGCRLREILGLQWGHVDLDRGLLFLPDSKTGRKTVVLNAPAMAVLASLPRIGRYVIAGAAAGTKEEKPRTDLKKPWVSICRRASLQGVRIHDLRHTHASIAAGGGLGLPIIGKLLGHKQAATTARYAHLDIDPQRRASEFIGSRLIEKMGEASPSTSSAKVIPLRSGTSS